MSKTAEAFFAKLYEGMPKRKTTSKEKGEMSKDYFGPHPNTWKTVRYVTEKEYREIMEEE